MRLGAHMSISGGKYKAIERGDSIDCKSIQIFIRNVRSWTSGPLSEKEINKFLTTRKKISSIRPIFSHNSYLINLASIDEEKLGKSYNAMLDELQKAHKLKLEYTVMHPGVIPKADEGKIKKEEALDQIASQINNLIADTKQSKVRLLLENTAGQGINLGDKFEDLIYIIDRIENKDRIGICFDTCHAFAAGYDFTTQEKYNMLWDNFDNTIGLQYLFAFHLNDAEKALGSNVDRHIHIGKGEIGKTPFGYFVNDKQFENHPGVLETPKGKDMKEDVMNLEVLRSLIN